MADRRVALVLWLIDHHPESSLHANMTASIVLSGPNSPGAAYYADAKARWLKQVDLHPYDAHVLSHAADALLDESLSVAIELLRRARKLDPDYRTGPLADVYSMVLEWNTQTGGVRTSVKNPTVAAEVRNELLGSSDVVLVGAVARRVVEFATVRAVSGRRGWDFDGLKGTAFELTAHAQLLDPQSCEWADLMEGVKVLPVNTPGTPTAPRGLK